MVARVAVPARDAAVDERAGRSFACASHGRCSARRYCGGQSRGPRRRQLSARGPGLRRQPPCRLAADDRAGRVVDVDRAQRRGAAEPRARARRAAVVEAGRGPHGRPPVAGDPGARRGLALVARAHRGAARDVVPALLRDHPVALGGIDAAAVAGLPRPRDRPASVADRAAAARRCDPYDRALAAAAADRLCLGLDCGHRRAVAVGRAPLAVADGPADMARRAHRDDRLRRAAVADRLVAVEGGRPRAGPRLCASTCPS